MRERKFNKQMKGRMNQLKNLKRVVHVTFDMRIGGAEQVICNLVENTDPLKYEASILCIDPKIGPFGKILQEKGYQITSLDRKPGFDFSLIAKVRQYLISKDVDILHCHQYTPYVYGVLGALLTKCRVIFTEHGRFFPDQRKLKRVVINPLLNMFTDYVTAISVATRDALVNFENFPENKIQVIYNGIDGTRFFHPEQDTPKNLFSICEDSYVIGTVARLDHIKNQKMMIKALKIVHKTHPNTFLLIVGDGPERKRLEKIAHELKLSAHMIFTGFRQDTQLFYKNMDIFLLTSFSEGTAMTLLEAMVSGLPCIATNVGGNPEIVKDTETGFIIPSDDERALADKIDLLLANNKLKQIMSNNARQRYAANYTVEKMVKKYETIYGL
jgi:glycosyltransferase involved in cell wall biosynthesis